MKKINKKLIFNSNKKINEIINKILSKLNKLEINTKKSLKKIFLLFKLIFFKKK